MQAQNIIFPAQVRFRVSVRSADYWVQGSDAQWNENSR